MLWLEDFLLFGLLLAALVLDSGTWLECWTHGGPCLYEPTPANGNVREMR